MLSFRSHCHFSLHGAWTLDEVHPFRTAYSMAIEPRSHTQQNRAKTRRVRATATLFIKRGWRDEVSESKRKFCEKSFWPLRTSTLPIHRSVAGLDKVPGWCAMNTAFTCLGASPSAPRPTHWRWNVRSGSTDCSQSCLPTTFPRNLRHPGSSPHRNRV